MSYGLSMEHPPTWMDCSFRYFEKHERHMSRKCVYMCVLIMVFEGELRFTEDGVPVTVGAGEYYIQRYGRQQEGTEESNSPKYFFIHFKDTEFSDTDSALPIAGKADFSVLFPLFKQMETLRLTGAPLLEKQLVFYEILSALRKTFTQKSKSAVVTKIVSMVTEDIRHPFSLEEVATRCGYSKSQIINIFRKETGKTPHTFVNDMKVQKAKQLLLLSDSSYASISVECGFGNYTNFYRCFYRAEGCTPAEWKKQNRMLQKIE